MEAITKYLQFMYNHWNENTCHEIFDPLWLGDHIWNKWCRYLQHGLAVAINTLWLEIDNECKSALYNYIMDR